MKTNDIFSKAYLEQLAIIKEDTEQMPADIVENEVETDVETDVEEPVLQRVTFLTSDQDLIDALNSGFEEAVFFVNVKDEATGEDTVKEVKISKDSFGEFEIKDEIDDESDEIDEIDDETEEFDDIEECGSNEQDRKCRFSIS